MFRMKSKQEAVDYSLVYFHSKKLFKSSVLLGNSLLSGIAMEINPHLSGRYKSGLINHKPSEDLITHLQRLMRFLCGRGPVRRNQQDKTNVASGRILVINAPPFTPL